MNNDSAKALPRPWYTDAWPDALAFAHFARLESFAIYAIVYLVYFFPWRLLRRENTATPSAA
jgi:hypothetical protein